MIITLRKIKQIKYFILFVSLWFHGSFCFRHPGIKIVPLHHVKGPLIVQKIIYIPISFTHFHDRLVNLKLVWRFFKKKKSPVSVICSYQHRGSGGCFCPGSGPGDLQGRLPQRAFPSLWWRGGRTTCPRAARMVLWRRRRGRGRRRQRGWPGVGPQLLWVGARQAEEREDKTGKASVFQEMDS